MKYIWEPFQINPEHAEKVITSVVTLLSDMVKSGDLHEKQFVEKVLEISKELPDECRVFTAYYSGRMLSVIMAAYPENYREMIEFHSLLKVLSSDYINEYLLNIRGED